MKLKFTFPYRKRKHILFGKHKCDICLKIFEVPSLLDIHKRLKHFGEALFKCDQCDFNGSSKQGLRRHVRVQHEGLKEVCDICGQLVAVMSEHLKKVHSEQAMREEICELCGASVKFTHLATHMANKHPKNLICTLCDKLFVGAQRNLESHLAQEHQVHCIDKDFFVCHKRVCMKKCHTSSELQNHLKNEHKMKTIHQCDQCEHSFVTNTLLTLHKMDFHELNSLKAAETLGSVSKVVEVKNTNTFECDQCDKKFKSYRTLFDHKKQVHNKANHLKCDQCEWTTHEPYRMKKHILTKHTKATKFPCDQCSFVTNLNSKLNQHKRQTHEGYKPNSCSECGKPFHIKSMLAKHMLKQHNILYKYSSSK